MDKFLLTQLFFGPLMLVLSILYKLFPPKKINSLYGYRTSRFMRSNEAWEFANRLSASLFLYASILTILAQVIFNMTLQESQTQIYSAIVLVALIAGTIPITEIQLRKRFDKNGIPTMRKNKSNNTYE